jgi:hypothetical protein
MFVLDNQYVCEMCDSVFYNEDLLINHIKERHIKVYEDKSIDVGELYEALKKEFPDDIISIDDGEGWYTEYRIHIKHNGMDIEQHLGNDKNRLKNNPEFIEGAISEIKSKINTAEDIVKRLKEIGQFDTLNCRDFDQGQYSDEDKFTFIFKLPGEEKERIHTYYPWGKDSDVEKFIDGFKQYFVDKLEGIWLANYNEGYFEEFTIDGVSIDGLISRAKKVRLEIIE